MAAPNFDITPTWVIPVEDKYNVLSTRSDSFKKEYNLLSTIPNRSYKLIITGVTDTDFLNRVEGHWRGVSGTFAAFHWITVPSYIDGGGGTGVSMYGRWATKPNFKPKAKSWDVQLIFEKHIY